MSIEIRQDRFHIAAPQPGPRRPATLIRAAQAGQGRWRRDRDLARLLGLDQAPDRAAGLAALRRAEWRQEAARRARAPDYDPHRHVLLMIALLAELQAGQDASGPAQGTGPGPALRLVARPVPPNARGTCPPAPRA
ncbi:hypothetical protein SAMN05421538_102343 [Paracoccus isoporae]|uniref:Uncharacterized protein n=1 Tax=Paracoccus isoporae TaxID=591205 RepID=A0A1G6XCI9_9RHOB|nr:DUF6477 family protein [Paracoccus isoporae]SDD75006.1 hypothetical protein SAMN05421538_102343 [Paracoccus isoporae]